MPIPRETSFKIGQVAFKPYNFPIYITEYIQDAMSASELLASLKAMKKAGEETENHD